MQGPRQGCQLAGRHPYASDINAHQHVRHKLLVATSSCTQIGTGCQIPSMCPDCKARALAGKSYAYCCRGSAGHGLRHPNRHRAVTHLRLMPHYLPTTHTATTTADTHAPPACTGCPRERAAHQLASQVVRPRSDTQAEAHARHASTGNSACAVLPTAHPAHRPPVHCRETKHNRSSAAHCRRWRPHSRLSVHNQLARASLIKRPLYLPPTTTYCAARKCFF